MKTVLNILPLFAFFFSHLAGDMKRPREKRGDAHPLSSQKGGETISGTRSPSGKGAASSSSSFSYQEAKNISLRTSTSFPEHSKWNELTDIFSYPNTQAFGCGESSSTVQKFKACLAVWFCVWLLTKTIVFWKGHVIPFSSLGAVMSHLHNLML